MLLSIGNLLRAWLDAHNILAEHIKYLRYTHYDGNPPLADLPHNLVWIVPAHEDNRARQCRRDEDCHSLPEEVTKWRQVKKSYWREWAEVLPKLHCLALDRNDVG